LIEAVEAGADKDQKEREEILSNILNWDNASARFIWQGTMYNNSFNMKLMDPDNAQQVVEAVKHAWAYSDWMNADRKIGESEQDFVFKHLPSLKHYGDNFNVKDLHDHQVRVNLYQLSLIPEEVHKQLAGKGVTHYFGSGGVPNLDEMEEYRGKIAPGREDRNGLWDDVGGCYRPKRNYVITGTGTDNGSAAVAAHEAGHAMGSNFGYDDSPELIKFHEEVYDKLNKYNAYFTRGGPGGSFGRKELLAEGIAKYVKNGRADVVAFANEGFVDWLEKEVLKVGKGNSNKASSGTTHSPIGKEEEPQSVSPERSSNTVHKSRLYRNTFDVRQGNKKIGEMKLGDAYERKGDGGPGEAGQAAQAFPGVTREGETVARINSIEVAEGVQGQGIGQQLYLGALSSHGADWYYNTQTYPGATNALKALAKKGLIEIHWDKEPDWGEKGGVHLIKLTDKGREAAAGNVVPADKENLAEEEEERQDTEWMNRTNTPNKEDKPTEKKSGGIFSRLWQARRGNKS
jgi:hypothetical protein